MAKKIKKYSVSASVRGGKYLGEVEATSPAEAIQKAWDLDSCHVSMCHQCSDECEDPEVDKIFVEEIDV